MLRPYEDYVIPHMGCHAQVMDKDDNATGDDDGDDFLLVFYWF